MASTTKARQPVAQEGELNLGATFGSAGVLSKDVENHRRTIDCRPSEDLLEVALLCRTQIVVEDHRVDIMDEAELV